jgi:hypothetical protein
MSHQATRKRFPAIPESATERANAMKLCEIDKAVLAAHEAGKDWKSVRGIRRARRFGRVLARAKRRKAAQG